MPVCTWMVSQSANLKVTHMPRPACPLMLYTNQELLGEKKKGATLNTLSGHACFSVQGVVTLALSAWSWFELEIASMRCDSHVWFSPKELELEFVPKLEFELRLGNEIWWWGGHKKRAGGHGMGAGCAMKVGISSPGINTETPLAYTVICRIKEWQIVKIYLEKSNNGYVKSITN